jgi:hypothetical protein
LLLGEKFIDATQEAKFKKLRKFNALMGCLHLFQAVLMLAIANWAVKMTIITTYLHFPGPGMAPVPEIQVLGTVPLGPMVALFLLMSAIAHFVIASPWGYPWYVRNLKLNINKARWIEYAVSSSFMLVVVAWLCGVWDIGTIILLFSVNACMNLFGYMMELHNQTTKKTDWTAFIFGCFAGLMPWVVLFMFFFGAVSYAAIPNFVYAIMISIAVFFNIFAVNMLLQYKKVGKWKDYLYGEYVYIVLSLVAKSLLAWQVFAGTLRG